MFWWGFPVMCTGATIFVVGLVISVIVSLVNIYFDIPWFTLAIVIAIDILGVSMAIIGFFCWCMAEIWGPYV